jgi:hypothetical protein
VSRPVARYRPSRRYLLLLLFALMGAMLSTWSGLRWPVAWFAAAGFAISAAALVALVSRPAIEIHESHLQVGRRAIPWRNIRRVDRTGWNAPLVMRLKIAGNTSENTAEENLLLVYPGELESSTSLLRHLRRYSKEALLDGVPYPQYWGEKPAQPPQSAPPARYPVLRPEDEEEVEQMFQRLKSAGRIEQRGPDEK